MRTHRAEPVVVGISHRTAPIEVRERFALRGAQLAAWVDDLVRDGEASECVVLSTCNRTECYVAGDIPADAARRVGRRLCEAAGLAGAGEAYLRSLDGFEAVRHLFRVAGGLDSLVIGEPQIQGQVSGAYHGEGHALGPVLHRLFQSALAAGGRIRAGTSIGHGAMSIPSAAVSLARKVFGSLTDCAVLVLGTGEMGQLTVRCLRSEGVRRVYVASRNPARAERVGRALEGIPIERGTALTRMPEVDLMIACTESDGAFVSVDHLGGRAPEAPPLVILDIAVPRNVDPAAGRLADVFLYNIDDLQRVVDRTREARAIEQERAEAIVTRHAARYWTWHRARTATPAIRALRDRSFALVEDALGAGAPAGPRDADAQELARVASRAALNKILHGPTLAIRRLAERSDANVCLDGLMEVLHVAAAGSESGGIADAEAG